MIIEEKNLSSTEKILFFPTTAPIIGTFSIKDTSSFDLVKNLKQINLAKDFILTKDFLYIEAQSQELLEDLYLICLGELDDYISSPSPQVAPIENMTHKITKILKLIIAPFLNKDGGDIEFSSYENNTVYVKFLGKCNGCPYAARTLKERVEKNLVSYLPEVKKAELI